MTTPMLMSQHPTEELLAEYIDDKLDTATRPAVTDHLASCGECREIVLMTADFQASEEPANVTHGTFGKSWLGVAGLAAAAAIAVFVIQPAALFGPDFDEAVAASQRMDTRPSPGRFAEKFAYKPLAPSYRGGATDDGQDNLGAQVAFLEMQDQLTRSKKHPHLLGMTQLFNARDRAETTVAVESLQQAYDKARGEKRDVIAIDLAAALLQLGHRWSGDKKDYERALELVNDVLTRSQRPEALFNRAFALESLQRDAEAIRAWDDYLKADPNSEWAQEALRRKTTLAEPFP